MSDINVIRKILTVQCSYSELQEEALRNLDFLEDRNKFLNKIMKLAADAGQFGDMGSFENWIHNAISAVKERSGLLNQIAGLKKENELLKQKPNQMVIEDILERLTRLEKRIK